LITHTITHIAHTLRLSAEWSHLTICKKLFDNVARSCFNCSIDNATGARDMNKTEQKQLAAARAIAPTMPAQAARIIAILRRSTRNNVTLAFTAAAIGAHQLETHFVPGTNYMLTH
jgi:hypothetical protein